MGNAGVDLAVAFGGDGLVQGSRFKVRADVRLNKATTRNPTQFGNSHSRPTPGRVGNHRHHRPRGIRGAVSRLQSRAQSRVQPIPASRPFAPSRTTSRRRASALPLTIHDSRL